MSDNFNKISGQLLYVQMSEPVKAYAKAGAPVKAPEWKCSVAIVDEEMVDALEEYAKSLDTMLSLKKVKTANFEEVYHCPPPEGAEKNVWVLTLRKSCELGKTGRPVPIQFQPKVFEKVGNVMVDVTHSKLIGNNSYGTVSIDRFDRSNGGSSLYLKNLLVTTMVEYIKKDSEYEAGSEFGEDVPVSKTPAKTAAKPTVKPKAKPQDDFDEDMELPF